MSQHQASILLVDDNKANLLAMEAVLEPLGERLVRATSGQEAIRLVEEEEFAVILLDVRMPGIDGFETAVRMRQRDKARNTPIIFLTAAAEAGEESMLRGYAEGGADFIQKPFRPEILRSKVKVFVTVYRQARQLRETIQELQQAQDEVHSLNAVLEQRVEERTRAANAELEERRRAEAALREADQRLRGIMDNASVAIQIKDPEGRYIMVNRFWEIMTRATAAEVIGKTPRDFYPPEVAEKLLQRDQEVLRAGTSIQFEETVQVGEKLSIFISTKFPLFDSSGTCYAIGGIAIDITERRRVEEALISSESRFRALFEQSPISIQIVSPEGFTLRANRAWERLWNSSIDQLEGYNVLTDSYLEAKGISDLVRQAFTGKYVEIPALRFDPSEIGRVGRPRWVEAYFYPIMDDSRSVREVALMLLDVTERKNAETELIRLNDELTGARDAALNASQAKSTFLANMSHELRTPLNAIIGYAEMLSEEMVELEQPRIADDIEKIRISGMHLLTVISDILDISKIEAGRMQLIIEEFDPEVVVREAVTLVTPLIEKKNNRINLNCDDLGKMRSDRTRLRQVIFNLLSNAAKFTENGDITVDCKREIEDGNNWLLLMVTDTGIGISSEQQQSLFQKFHQADTSTTRLHGGTGLGLAISKLLSDMMGGDIMVQSRVGKGSTFTVRLPMHVPEKESSGKWKRVEV